MEGRATDRVVVVVEFRHFSLSSRLFVQKLFDVLIRGVHDAPTDEGTRTIHRNAFVNVADPATSFIVHVAEGVEDADARRAHRTLHRYFDDVQRVEERTEECTDYGAGEKLLHSLGDVVVLEKRTKQL